MSQFTARAAQTVAVFMLALSIAMRAFFAASALASQATLVTPGAPLPMTGLASFLNSAFLSIGSCNAGTSAPANGTGGAAFPGECWINTSSNPWVFNYTPDGTHWAEFGTLNTSSFVWTFTNGTSNALLNTNNLSDVSNAITSLINLGSYANSYTTSGTATLPNSSGKVFNNTAAGQTFTMPATCAAGQIYIPRNIQSGTLTASKNSSGGALFGPNNWNVSSLPLPLLGDFVALMCDGTNWGVIGGSADVIGGLSIQNNLSDLASASSARTNLGLGNLATQNTSSSLTWTVPQTISSATSPQFTLTNPSADSAAINFTGVTQTVQVNETSLGGGIKTVSNGELDFGTNNTTRFHLSAAGGLYADGVTGGDKGAGTINAQNLYVAGTALGPIATLGVGTGLQSSGGNLNLLPASASVIGGVESITCSSHQWLNTISTAGVPACGQPGFSDLSGALATAQLPVLTSANIWLGNGSNVATAVTISGDCTLANSGAITCTKTNGTPLGTMATVNSPVPIANGGTAQTTATAARSSSGLNIDECTSTGDANYSIAAGDRCVYHTALTAARTDTLPAANSVNAGQRLYIVDFAGVASASHTITIQRTGSDTINGSSSAVAVNSQYGWSVWMSDGSSRWTYQQATGGGGGGGTVTSITCGNITITTSGSCPPPMPQGRLTLQANTPVMTSSNSAQTTVRYDCYHGGNLVPVYNGTTDVVLTIGSCEIADAINSGSGNLAAGQVVDIWAINNSGSLMICHAQNGSGGGWASDGGSNTVRGTGYSQLDTTTRLYITNANAITHCFNGATDKGTIGANQATYLGTVYTSGTGQVSWIFPAVSTTPQAGMFGVWNAYNRVRVSGTVGDSTSSWTYNSNSVREINNDTTAIIQYVKGIDEDQFSFRSNSMTQTSTTAGTAIVGICYNTTFIFSGIVGAGTGNSTSALTGSASASLVTNDLGFNYVAQCEATTNANAQTFRGTSFGSLGSSTGMTIDALMFLLHRDVDPSANDDLPLGLPAAA